MSLQYRQLVDELLQLCLWIELLSRQENGVTPDQRGLIQGRVTRALRRLEGLA